MVCVICCLVVVCVCCVCVCEDWFVVFVFVWLVCGCLMFDVVLFRCSCCSGCLDLYDCIG